MAATSELDVFAYLDYRAYLRDLYVEQKERGRGFSYRVFSRWAGLRSPNYLKMVIDGERNLTQDMAKRFAAACGLKSDAAEFFADLVAFNQAKTPAARTKHYKKLTGFKKYREAHQLELAQERYHSKWYLPAIRELAARSDFSEDPKWIVARIRPAITAAQAKRAVATLLELGLLTRDEASGRVAQSEPLVSTGPETTGIHVMAYHRAMLERASASMDEFAREERDISSLTLCLGADGLSRIKQRLQRFRRELLELSALEDDPRQVVQINLQLFPLSTADDE